VAEDLARGTRSDRLVELAIQNAPALRAGGLRLLLVLAAGTGVVWAVHRGRLRAWWAVAALAAVLVADLYSVARHFFVFSPGAAVTYASDPLMARLQQTPYPYRAWAPEGAYGQLNPYPRSWLMAAGIPTLFGYHGNELRFFDDLLGGKNDWRNQVNPGLLRMFAVRYAILRQPLEVPGFHQVLGPVETTLGDSAWLYEADTVPPYAWVVPAAAHAAEDQLVPTVADPRFPFDRVVLLPDTARAPVRDLSGGLPEPLAAAATVVEWRAGRMAIRIDGAPADSSFLVIAENWYKDWTATVDGRPARVHRGNNTLLTVELPPAARDVVLEFASPAYRRGRAISLASMAGLGVLLGLALRRRRQQPGA
jgi:hypothetical protein